MSFNYAEIFKLVVPETIIVVTAFAALLLDMVALRKKTISQRASGLAVFASLGCVCAIAWMWAVPNYGNLLHDDSSGRLQLAGLDQAFRHDFENRCILHRGLGSGE